MKLFPTFTAWLETGLRFCRGLRFPTGSAARLWFDAGFFFRQLASTTAAGVPLPQALTFLSEAYQSGAQVRLTEVRTRLEQGEPFSVALEALPGRWVTPGERGAIAAAERSGRLVEVLNSLAVERETVAQTRNQVRSVLLYPVAVLMLAGVVLYIVTWKVMPVFESLYASMRLVHPDAAIDLPAGTRYLVAFVKTLFIPYILVVTTVLLWLAAGIVNPALPLLPRWAGRHLVRFLPIARKVHRNLLEVRFARTLSVLLSAGVALPEALDRCADAVGGRDDGRRIIETAERIRAGEAPSVALRGLDFLSPAFVWFLADSERRGDFIEITGGMAEVAQERLVASLDLAQRIVEPVSIVGLGVVVGFMVVHLYWPMFRLVFVMGNM